MTKCCSIKILLFVNVLLKDGYYYSPKKCWRYNNVHVNQDVQLFGDEYILTHTHCIENCNSIILQPVWRTRDHMLHTDHNYTFRLESHLPSPNGDHLGVSSHKELSWMIERGIPLHTVHTHPWILCSFRIEAEEKCLAGSKISLTVPMIILHISFIPSCWTICTKHLCTHIK